MAAAPAPLVAPDTTDIAAEPQKPKRPQLPTQDVRFTDDNNFQNNELPTFIPSTSTSDGSSLSLHDNDLQLQNPAAFEPQGSLLAPRSTEAMPTVDQGTLRVFATHLSHYDDSDSSVNSSRESSIYIRNFRTTVQSENQQTQSSTTDCPTLLIFDGDYHVGIIQRKPFKTKYRLKRAVFQLLSQLLPRVTDPESEM